MSVKLLEKALRLNPDDEQLVYELSIISPDPQYTVNLILNNKHTRDDVITELARAYNQLGEYDKALETLLSHTFVACEGGEHAIADQYMFAHHAKGRELMAKGDYAAAEQRKACYNSLIGFGELFRGNREEALKRFAYGNDMFGRLEIE